jgi:hypothetical protein
MHPRGRRCSSLEYFPIFSVVAPGPRGASRVSVLRHDFHQGLLAVAAGRVFQQTTHSTRVGISVTDALVRALRTAGTFPPLAGEVECRVVAQTAPLARTFTPPRRLHTMRHAGGFLSTEGTWTAVAPGPPQPLAPGTYSVEVRGDFYRPLVFTLVWPPAPGQSRVPLDGLGQPDTLALLPAAHYPLPDGTTSRFQLGPTLIRGALFADNGAPLAGRRVEALNLPILNPPELPPLGAWPFMATESSATGDWALVLPGRRYINAAAESLPVTNPPTPPLTAVVTTRVTYAPGVFTDVPLTVEFAAENALKNTALRGQVTGPGGRPLPGVQITTSLNARQSVTRADGVWFLYFDLNQADAAGVTVTATRPGGATASAVGIPVRRFATVVVPTMQFP